MLRTRLPFKKRSLKYNHRSLLSSFGMSSEPKASPLQLSPLVCGFWGSSLQSLDLSGCHFLSNTFADRASCMIAMERLVLREAKGDTLKQVVGGLSVWG